MVFFLQFTNVFTISNLRRKKVRLWKKIIICVTLSLSILGAGLAIKWDNEAQANFCPPNWCCVTGINTYELQSGSTLTFVTTSCGSYSVAAYPSGDLIIIVCPSGGGCIAY